MKEKKIPQDVKDIFKSFGRKGGKATLEAHGKNHFRELAKKRWAKHRKEQAANPKV